MTEHYLTVNDTKVVLKNGKWGLPTESGGLVWISHKMIRELANQIDKRDREKPQFSKWIDITSEKQAAFLRARYMKIINKLSRRSKNFTVDYGHLVALYNIRPGKSVRFQYLYNSEKHGDGYRTYQIPEKRTYFQKRKKYIKIMQVT